ncbi:hypothetical protein C9J85_04575 [Haloferax sp. wsp5]|nr:hypothetical protein C9J85_04575 [Haloferax sp. wsp5]
MRFNSRSLHSRDSRSAYKLSSSNRNPRRRLLRKTGSPVTVSMTSGPVMNMWLVSRTMKVKSVSAGL